LSVTVFLSTPSARWLVHQFGAKPTLARIVSRLVLTLSPCRSVGWDRLPGVVTSCTTWPESSPSHSGEVLAVTWHPQIISSAIEPTSRQPETYLAGLRSLCSDAPEDRLHVVWLAGIGTLFPELRTNVVTRPCCCCLFNHTVLTLIRV